jgi:NADH dehydrogenase FAD-containing subunit
MSKKRKQELSLVVIGGGIGGVSCAQELARLNPEQDVLLISGSDAIFEARNFMLDKCLFSLYVVF